MPDVPQEGRRLHSRLPLIAAALSLQQQRLHTDRTLAETALCVWPSMLRCADTPHAVRALAAEQRFDEKEIRKLNL